MRVYSVWIFYKTCFVTKCKQKVSRFLWFASSGHGNVCTSSQLQFDWEWVLPVCPKWEPDLRYGHRKACDGWTEFDLIAFLVCKLLHLGSVVLWSGFRNVFQIELTGSCGALKQRVTFSAWSGSQPHIYTSLLLSWLLCLGVFLIVAYLKCILLMAASERALYGVIGENSFLLIYVKMNRLFGV